MQEVLEDEAVYVCDRCHDTGMIEIMGGSDADEWGVVDVKRCECLDDDNY